MPNKFSLPNRAEEYRHRAEEARTQAEGMKDKSARDAMLQVADTWERMAQWEDKNNPPRRVPGRD